MQIRTRITLQFVSWSSLLFLMAFTGIYLAYKQQNKQDFYARLKSKAKTSGDLLLKVEQVDSSLLRIIHSTNKDILADETILVYNELKEQIYTNKDSVDFELREANLKQVFKNKEFKEEQGDYFVVGLPYKYKGHVYAIISAAVDKAGYEKLNILRSIFGAAFLIVLVAMFVIGWIFAGRALRPISTIMNQVDAIAGENLSKRLNITRSKDEIARLANTFNKMMDRVEQGVKSQKQFLSNASHELRRPLTAISAQLEVTLLKDRSPEEYRQALRSIHKQSKNLNATATRLLELGKLNQDERVLTRTWIRLDETVLDVISQFGSETSNQYPIRFEAQFPEAPEGLEVFANEELLQIALKNLIENALKFSKDPVHICLGSNSEGLKLIIKDNGIGIPPEELSHIFEPFYRASNANTYAGSGIGLSIVYKVVEAQGIKMSIESRLLEGTTITLQFGHLKPS